jgi:hypothetical protein
MKWSVANLVWLLVYLATMGSAIWFMVQLRPQVIAQFSTAKSQADWETWRQEARRQQLGEGPVQRREPLSDQPPTLVLMRDHFAVSLAGVVVLGTALFVTLMIVIRGVFQKNTLHHARSGSASGSREPLTQPNDLSRRR